MSCTSSTRETIPACPVPDWPFARNPTLRVLCGLAVVPMKATNRHSPVCACTLSIPAQIARFACFGRGRTPGSGCRSVATKHNPSNDYPVGRVCMSFHPSNIESALDPTQVRLHAFDVLPLDLPEAFTNLLVDSLSSAIERPCTQLLHTHATLRTIASKPVNAPSIPCKREQIRSSHLDARLSQTIPPFLGVHGPWEIP